MELKIIVVGLGSMGKRRIRLIKKIYENCSLLGVDKKRERREQAKNMFQIECIDDLNLAIEEFKPDCAIICTSPLSHAAIIETCLNRSIHVFTELNLVADKYKTNVELAKNKGVILFLSSTFLYRKEIEFIGTKVTNTGYPVNYIYHTGQYLPDWHPWESYTEFFVGDKRTNGCREIFAIELPWIIKTFGKIKKFYAIGGKISSLDLDYADNYMLILEHENGNHGVLAVDIISRKPSRNLEVYGDEIFIKWDGTPDGLKQYNIETKEDININLYDELDKQNDYAPSVIENAYESELKDFFSQIAGKSLPGYTFVQDEEILNLIDCIERQIHY